MLGSPRACRRGCADGPSRARRALPSVRPVQCAVLSKAEKFTIGVETSAGGFSAGWCFELPGCYALAAPGQDIRARMVLAILEYAAWSHLRQAERLSLDVEQVRVVETIETRADLRAGDSLAFFAHDAEAPTGREFPAWANPHDLALDELRKLAAAAPREMIDHQLDAEGRTIRGILQHVGEMEFFYARQLAPGIPEKSRPVLTEPPFRELQDVHILLQQVVCGAPPNTVVRRDTVDALGPETWSVRKAMRRSTWHVRYHTWEARRSIGSLWLA